eukprot:5846943-Amphidinium_carterae.1
MDVGSEDLGAPEWPTNLADLVIAMKTGLVCEEDALRTINAGMVKSISLTVMVHKNVTSYPQVVAPPRVHFALRHSNVRAEGDDIAQCVLRHMYRRAIAREGVNIAIQWRHSLRKVAEAGKPFFRTEVVAKLNMSFGDHIKELQDGATIAIDIKLVLQPKDVATVKLKIMPDCAGLTKFRSNRTTDLNEERQ